MSTDKETAEQILKKHTGDQSVNFQSIQEKREYLELVIKAMEEYAQSNPKLSPEITDEEIKVEAYKRYPLKRDSHSEHAIRAGKLTAFMECGQWMRDTLPPLSCGCKDHLTITFTSEGDYCGNCGKIILKPQEREWISVEDALPESVGEYIILINGNSIGVAYFENLGTFEHFQREDYDDFDYTMVTHWQPLPKPPKTESK